MNTATKNSTVEGYRWISYYDEVEEKRFSDWDRCTNCCTCGRKIVHAYLLSDGCEYGKECVHLALGWKKADHRKVQVLLYEREQQKKEIERWGPVWERWAVGHLQLAITHCINRNYSPMRAPEARAETVVFEKAGMYVAVPGVCRGSAGRIAAAHGWEVSHGW